MQSSIHDHKDLELNSELDREPMKSDQDRCHRDHLEDLVKSLKKKERNVLHSSPGEIGTAGDAGATLLLMVSNEALGVSVTDRYETRKTRSSGIHQCVIKRQ